VTSENTDAVENSATETPAATPVAKRPRRATRAATAPADATGTSPAGTTPAVEPTTGTAAPEVAAEKPVAAPRRRTRKAATTEDAPAAAEGAPSGSATAEAAGSSTAPVKKATRSRKKVVAPADAAAEVVETAAAGSAAPEEATEAPAAKKRPSRAKKKPAADEVPAAVEAPAAAEVPASPEAPAAAEVPTVAGAVGTETAAPKRRRATRKAAAPSDAPSAGAGSTASASAEAVTPGTATPEAVTSDAAVSEVATPAAEPADAPAAPARRTRSRRATRPAAAAETPAEPVVEQPAEPVEAEEDEETAELATDAQGVALDVLAAFSGVTPEPEKPTASSGRLATTALLFQAPETAPRRRRRASAPAGSPEEIAAAAHAEAAEPETVVADAADTAESAESTGGSRRSRGRRGGRKRSGQPTEETVEEATEAAPVEAEDEVAEDQTAEQSEGEDTEDGEGSPRRRRRRGGRGRRSRAKDGDESTDTDDESGAEEDDESAEDETAEDSDSDDEGSGGSSRRRRRRRRSSRGGDGESSSSSSSGRSGGSSRDEVTALRGSTRLEAKRQRRREGRDAGRRRQIITEAEFLARRESVDRSMIVRELDGRTQIAVLEDGVLVEHYVSKQAQASMVGNVYLGRVQNVLPSMEAAFVDVGRGRNAVLYAGEVNWDAAGVEGGKTRRIEQALKSGDPVLVQVTKDPIGHKGARLTSQITLAGRYLVYVPGGGMTGISRKLPDNERSRLKKILREVVPDSAGVIVRTAAEGASEEELRADIARLQSQWEAIEKKSTSASAPSLLQGEPDMAIRVVRDIFNDDFNSLVIQGDEAWSTISGYIGELAPDLAEKVTKYTGTGDVFHDHRVDEQLAKGMDRKVWLPSGGSLVIDRTEAMTVVDVNTGKFTGAGGTLEETVTRNNLEAAEEIVRQLRLRDIGGIIVIDFIDMVLESNRDLVLRRLVECLGRDRTKHQVAEVTSLGLVQMTRKRVGQGLVEAFSETCEHCHGRGFIVHTEPVEKSGGNGGQHQHQPQPEKSPAAEGEPKRSRRKRGGSGSGSTAAAPAADKDQAGVPVLPEAREQVNATLATIAAAAAHAHQHEEEETPVATPESPVVAASATAEVAAEAERPYLDVFAALGELGTKGEDPAEPVVEESPLALSPVDPSLFEDGEPIPETPIEDLPVEDQAAEQHEQ
jgi:ribonuclease E